MQVIIYGFPFSNRRKIYTKAHLIMFSLILSNMSIDLPFYVLTVSLLAVFAVSVNRHVVANVFT